MIEIITSILLLILLSIIFYKKNYKKSKNIFCAICLKTHGYEYTTFNCNHSFHSSCIELLYYDYWQIINIAAKKIVKCPVCKSKYNTKITEEHLEIIEDAIKEKWPRIFKGMSNVSKFYYYDTKLNIQIRHISSYLSLVKSKKYLYGNFNDYYHLISKISGVNYFIIYKICIIPP